jgi:FMN-dependent NADH-azoreductase
MDKAENMRFFIECCWRLIAASNQRTPESAVRTVLQINTSLFANEGQSSRLASALIQGWKLRHPDDRIVVRDLAADPVPHLTAERFAAFLTPPEQRTGAQQAIAAQSDALIEELRAADVVVLGLPMYNFGVPSTLKAYFDHIARAGVTFRYTANGPQGLLGDKKVYVLAARGGQYAGTALDTQTSYVRDFLAFLGLRDVEFVYAEGLAMGPDAQRTALAAANANILKLAA